MQPDNVIRRELIKAKHWVPLVMSFTLTLSSGAAAFWETGFAAGALLGGVLMLISMIAWWEDD